MKILTQEDKELEKKFLPVIAKDIDEFEKKIKDFLNGKLKSVAKNAYPIAIERDQKNIGKQLKEVYEEVLKK